MTGLSIGGKSRNGMNLSQARWQVAAVWGYLTPRSDSEKSVRACQAASWLGAVQVGLDSGRDLPAVPVGHEPHPGRGTGWTTQVGTVAWGQDCLRSPRAGPSARRIPPRASLPCGRCPLYDQTRPDAAVVPARAHTCAQKEAPSSGPGPRYLSHVLDPVHAPPRPRYGPSGRRPGEQARTIGPDRARGRSPGRGLLQRTRAATRATASATASAGPRNGPHAEHPR